MSMPTPEKVPTRGPLSVTAPFLPIRHHRYPPGVELVSLGEIRAAADRLAPFVRRTPIVPLTPTGVLLKAESLHPTGSFKIRGALHQLLLLGPAEREQGVVAHSSGNHAIAVAHAGALLGVATTVVMPSNAPVVKLERTRQLGAEVIVVGAASRERQERAEQLVVERGCALVEPFDSRATIAATGTIMLEALEQASAAGDRLAEVWVPVSGGGLAAGVAAAAKHLDPTIRVVGVEPELAADALASWQAGEPVTLPADQMARTLADGLRVQRVGSVTWPHLREFLDDIVTVSETEICEAMRQVAGEARLVAEPSGAVSVAAATAGRGGSAPPKERLAILSGGNVDLALFASILSGVT